LSIPEDRQMNMELWRSGKWRAKLNFCDENVSCANLSITNPTWHSHTTDF
jgi:hypothetical protein